MNVNPPYYIEVKVNNGAENLSGYQPWHAAIRLTQGNSWTNPERLLFAFGDNGEIGTPSGMVLGDYSPGVWYTVKVRYDLANPTTVRVSYWVDNAYKGQEEFHAISQEASLTYLELTVGQGTARFDDVRVGEAGPISPEENSFAGSVRTLSELSTAPAVIGTNLGFALATILVFYFAATLFNSAFKENYKIIQGWLQRGSKRFRFISTFFREMLGGLQGVIVIKRRLWLQVFLVTAICALIYVFLQPYFINLLRGLALYISLFVGILIATLAYEGTQVLVSVRRFHVPAAIKIYPIAIVIAGIFVLVSRNIHFHPGLIYGFVGTYTALSVSKGKRQELDKGQQARTIVLGTLVVLIIAAFAFWLRGEYVPNVIQSETSFRRYLVDDILVAAFVIGLEGVVFSLVPFFFLDGYKIARWNKLAWSAISGLGGFAFYSIIINDKQHPLQEAVKDTSVLMMIGIMVVSLLISGVFYLYFWLRRRRLRKARIAEQPSVLPERVYELDDNLRSRGTAKQTSALSKEIIVEQSLMLPDMVYKQEKNTPTQGTKEQTSVLSEEESQTI